MFQAVLTLDFCNLLPPVSPDFPSKKSTDLFVFGVFKTDFNGSAYNAYANTALLVTVMQYHCEKYARLEKKTVNCSGP